MLFLGIFLLEWLKLLSIVLMIIAIIIGSYFIIKGLKHRTWGKPRKKKKKRRSRK